MHSSAHVNFDSLKLERNLEMLSRLWGNFCLSLKFGGRSVQITASKPGPVFQEIRLLKIDSFTHLIFF